MTTKPSNVGLDRGIYSGPFDAFTNYMNILGDFINRVNALYPPEIENDELNALLTTIRNQGDEIEMKDKEITRLKARLEKLEPKEAPKKAAPKKAAPKKAAPKKTAPKKAAPVAEPKAEEPKVEEPKAEEKK
jgi:alpha-amylase